jgi:hypothetical protein
MRVRIGNGPDGWRTMESCTPHAARSLVGVPVQQGIPPTGASPSIPRRVVMLKGSGHGRPFDYIAGCRCDLCRDAHRAVEVLARERRRARAT